MKVTSNVTSNLTNLTMKDSHHSTDSNSNLFLTGSILLANLDYSGLTNYAVKAAIGGLIWMVFKIAGEYLCQKITRK